MGGDLRAARSAETMNVLADATLRLCEAELAAAAKTVAA
jgi:hypothetical protein